jgi:hypothetical protein
MELKYWSAELNKKLRCTTSKQQSKIAFIQGNVYIFEEQGTGNQRAEAGKRIERDFTQLPQETNPCGAYKANKHFGDL